jgi:hypothetical protein
MCSSCSSFNQLTYEVDDHIFVCDTNISVCDTNRASQTACYKCPYGYILQFWIFTLRARFAKCFSLLKIWPKDTHRRGLGVD